MHELFYIKMKRFKDEKKRKLGKEIKERVKMHKK